MRPTETFNKDEIKIQVSLEKRLEGKRLRQGESHSPVHSPSPGHSARSEQVRRKVKFYRATSSPD